MIEINELKAAVEEGLKLVEKKKGVKEAEVYASSNHLSTMRICYATNVPSNGLEEPKSQEDFGLSVRVLFDNGMIGFGSVDSDLSSAGIEEAFRKAERNKVMDTDFHSLPSPNGKPKISNYHDKEIMDSDDGRMIDSAWGALNAAFNTLKANDFKKNLNITGELNYLGERMAVVNTNGIDASDESTISLGTLTTIFELDKDVAGMWFDSSPMMKNLDVEKIGSTSVEKALKLIDSKALDSGDYKVVLGRQVVSDLMYSRFAVELDSYDQKSTPYVGKLDTQIWSDKMTVGDDALLKDAIGTKAVTDEGLPTSKTELVKDGKLVNLLSNDYYAKKYKDDKRYNSANGFRFGGGGRNYGSDAGIHATNIVVEAGDYNDEDLVKEVKDGIYIGRIWYSYPVNGQASSDFTSTIRGDSYIIKNGEIDKGLIPNTFRINDNLDRIFNGVIGLSKEKLATIAWAEEAVVVTPEMAVESIRLDRIAKGLY